MAYIIYNANGGTGAPARQVASGIATISMTKPTKTVNSGSSSITYDGNGGTASKTSDFGYLTTSYSFLGWDTSSSATSVKYKPGATITVTGQDITLYAVWTTSGQTTWPTFTAPTAARNSSTGTYTAYFDATTNRGSCATDSLDASYTVSYSCNGWYTSTNGGVRWAIAGETYTPKTSGTAKLYAYWGSSYAYGTITLPTATKSNTYTYRTVTINANGGSSSVTSRSSSCATRYTFNGWYTAASGGTKIGNAGASFTLSYSRTLFAQFTSAVGSYGSVTLPTASQCTRSGYKLLGFSKSSTATTATYAPGTYYTPSATETLYAVWEPEGLIRIGNATYTPNAYYNGKWTQVIPYAHVNGQWKQGG